MHNEGGLRAAAIVVAGRLVGGGGGCCGWLVFNFMKQVTQ